MEISKDETRAYDYRPRTEAEEAEDLATVNLSTVLKRETKERKRWAVYIYPESIEEAKRLARFERKTIGEYVEDLIATSGKQTKTA